MDNASIIALSKAVKDKDAKDARSALTPGEHLVDVTVHIVGSLEIAPDTEKKSTSSIISEDALILCLKLAGCTRERALEIIQSVVSETIGMEAKAAKAKRTAMVDEFDPDGRISSMFEDLKDSLPKTKVAGAAKFKGEVVEVTAAAAAAALQTA